jgi:crotonobetainyl-CoA:carnitine CoA-transferase CaiB-like acyl-CoA transferase
VRDRRVLERGETVLLEHPELGRIADVIGPGVPIRFSAAPAHAPRPAPAVGQDNALVYGEWLGYGAAKLAGLRAAGII